MFDQVTRFYLGAALTIFPPAFFFWSLYPGDMGMLAGMGYTLFACGAILLLMTILEMKIAKIEITLVDEDKGKGSEKKTA